MQKLAACSTQSTDLCGTLQVKGETYGGCNFVIRNFKDYVNLSDTRARYCKDVKCITQDPLDD